MFECAENIKNCTIQYAIFVNNCYFCCAVCRFCVFLHTKYINIKNGELNCNIPRTRY